MWEEPDNLGERDEWESWVWEGAPPGPEYLLNKAALDEKIAAAVDAVLSNTPPSDVTERMVDAASNAWKNGGNMKAIIEAALAARPKLGDRCGDMVYGRRGWRQLGTYDG